MGITQPDAKIELRHLETIKRPPATGKTRAQLFANGDLVIFLSKQDSRNWPLEGIKIERTSIETPLIRDEQFRKGLLEAAIPEKGVLINFGHLQSSRSHPHW
ncbi:MAG TPA: hypothetical protein VMR77_02725 [Patescibacteria group bacterium]|nr:hypothetical protein [Patescibacteria group bacterium]